MATLGTFQYLGSNGLPTGALDGGTQYTGKFAYLGSSTLPIRYLLGSVVALGPTPINKLRLGALPVVRLYVGSVLVT